MKVKTKYTILVALIFASLCFANRGMIPMDPDVRIFEPNQRAMIAWDGYEEILLLSTDLSASESTMVLEVLPLPSEPVVKKGDLETFQKAIELINDRIRVPAVLSKRNGGEDKVPPPAGEVTFHKRIGAHDVSVTHLINSNGFVDWVKDYLKSLGAEKEVVSEEMKSLIEEYIEDGFVWFVFDVVSLAEETVTNEPIQYHFTSNSLYYPLKITKTGEGHTSIELLILTPRLLSKFAGLSKNMVELRHNPITITSDELRELNEDMYELLKEHWQMKLRIWEIKGDIKSFDTDLIAN